MNTLLRILRLSGWMLLTLLIVSLVLAGLLVGLAQEGLLPFGDAGAWHVHFDDPTVDRWVIDGEHGFWGFFGLVAGLAAVVFCLLVVLPVVLVLGVGLPLVVVVLALAGVASVLALPLAVPVLLLIWLLRRQPRPVS
jgi:hypothetical protein